MTIYCQVCLSLDSPMKKLSLESRNILEILIGKQLKNYGTDPSVCVLCDHLLYKTRTLRDMCIKTDCVWRSYAGMVKGPSAKYPDSYLRQQHTRFLKDPFMNITKTSNLCLYNYPNVNTETSMLTVANVKGQIKCFPDLKSIEIAPNAATNQAVNGCFTLVSSENITPNTAQLYTSGSATIDYTYELDIEYDQTEKPFGTTCEQDSNTDPLSNNRSSGCSLAKVKKVAKTTDVTVKKEPNDDINCEDLNKSSIDSNIFALHIKEEPQDINEDLPHLQINYSDPLIAENNIKSEELRHKVVDSQVGNKIIDQRRTLNSNQERAKRNKKVVKSFTCKFCRKKFSSHNYLKSHLLHHNDSKSFECDFCQKRFSWKHSLQRHLTIHSGSRTYKCKTCKIKFTDRNDLKSHELIHSNAVNKLYDCNICKKNFIHRSYLKSHMLIHSGSKHFKCKICETRFSQKVSLKRHLIAIHSGNTPYECEICKKKFSDPRYMKRHLLIHSDSKPYGCEVCEKKFAQKSSLQYHVVSHSDKKQYQCDICKKRFVHKDSLRNHIPTHTGSKPHECEICKRRFTQKGNLQCHMKVHTGSKPYECEVCKKRFAWKRSFSRHIEIHK